MSTSFIARLAIGGCLLLAAIVPAPAAAAETSFFGPIVPEVCNCENVSNGRATAPSYGCVLAVIQNLVNIAISLGIVVATLFIAYAGFTWMMSAGNPEKRSQGRAMLINVALGLLIVLSAWLVVDFIMKKLYNPSTSDQNVQFGPWHSILEGRTDDMCIVPIAQQTIPGLLGSLSTGVFGGQTVPNAPASGGGGGGNNCPAADPATMEYFPASVTSGDRERATPQTVQNFMNMRAAALQAGIDIKVVDGYRPESEQVYLWNNRSQYGLVARPCTMGGGGSNHNSGEALDLTVGCSNGNSNCNTATYRWLKTNGHRWNFYNNLQSDPPHWSPSGR